MNRKTLGLILLATALLSSASFSAHAAPKKPGASGDELPPDAHQLKIGDAAPDFSLLGVDGKTYTLADFKDSPLLMVVFLSNHCPVSHAAETRLLPYVAAMKGRGLAVVAINPNSAAAAREDELGYTQYTDSYADMKVYAKERGFPFPYLYDGDLQVTAKAYGCLCTPHVFLFDRERKLRYAGRFDNSRLPDLASVTISDAPNAVQALLAGQAVPVELTRPVGCSTKWKSEIAEVAAANEKWDSTPVYLDPIDVAGVAALARNDTQRWRLINVWATWCEPCVKEFPGLVLLSRRFDSRAFEMITVSLDDPKEPAVVQRFLDRQHAIVPAPTKAALAAEGRRTNNYYFTGTNTDAFGQALDAAWPGPLPYTILVAPGGKIVYRHSGGLDIDALRGLLVDHLGAYYDEARIKAPR
jgi:peroxiredoxin